MQPLTEDVWAERYDELRPLVADEFPRLQRQDLEAIGGSWDGLVEVVQRATRLDADVVRRRLGTVDVDVEPTDDPGEQAATVDNIRIATGFDQAEHDRVREVLRKLDRRLGRFPADAVDGELSVKDRDEPSQKVTLEVWLPDLGKLVATSKEDALQDGLMDCRADMISQIDEAVGRRRRH